LRVTSRGLGDVYKRQTSKRWFAGIILKSQRTLRGSSSVVQLG
jgi:hypothetical protein